MDRVWPLALLAPLFSALTLGCTSEACSVDSTEWWETCGDTGFDGDDGGEDDEWEKGDLIFVAFALDAEGALQEAEVGYVSANEDTLLCDAFHEVRSITSTQDCSDCEQAWILVLDEGEAEGSACGDWPKESGTEMGVGLSGAQAFLLQDGTWTALGEAEQWDDGWELIFPSN